MKRRLTEGAPDIVEPLGNLGDRSANSGFARVHWPRRNGGGNLVDDCRDARWRYPKGASKLLDMGTGQRPPLRCHSQITLTRGCGIGGPQRQS